MPAAPRRSTTRRRRCRPTADHLVVDLLGGGGSIGINMNVNEVLANLASEALGGGRGSYDPVHPLRHVNASQSTADVCHTAARLAVTAAAPAALDALDACAASLTARADAVARVPTLARTCLQDAMPTTADVLLRGHAAALARRAADLRAAVVPLDAVVLGGTVIGDGRGAPPAYRERVVPALAAVVGRSLRPHPHPADALQNGDDLRRGGRPARPAGAHPPEGRAGSAPAGLRPARRHGRAAPPTRPGGLELLHRQVESGGARSR